MKRAAFVIVAVISAVVFSIVSITAWTVGRGAAATTSPKGGTITLKAPVTPHLYLTIATPDQLGGTEDTGPAYLPSDFTLPADTDVILTITNFDNATPLTGDAVKYATAAGVIGKVSVETLDTVNPNNPGTVTQATSIDPATVAHTFTISKLGLNVPIPAQSKVTFSFHTGSAGTYDWQCFNPCGADPNGWGGAMAIPGHMRGKVTFV